MMSSTYFAQIIMALILVVIAGFIALPAMRRLLRNMYLIRNGSIAPGHSIDPNKVSFLWNEKTRIVFITWRDSKRSNKKFDVLFDPRRPARAEIRSFSMLWLKPVEALEYGASFCVTAILLLFGINRYVVIGIVFLCCFSLWLFTLIVYRLLRYLLRFQWFLPFSMKIFPERFPQADETPFPAHLKSVKADSE